MTLRDKVEDIARGVVPGELMYEIWTSSGELPSMLGKVGVINIVLSNRPSRRFRNVIDIGEEVNPKWFSTDDEALVSARVTIQRMVKRMRKLSKNREPSWWAPIARFKWLRLRKDLRRRFMLESQERREREKKRWSIPENSDLPVVRLKKHANLRAEVEE